MKHSSIFTLIVLFVGLEVAIAQDSPKKEDNSDEIFLEVESFAEPEAGMVAFYQYIGKNLKYPKEARKAGIEGKVFVQFIVEKDGSFNEIEIVKGIDPDCDAESARLFVAYNEDESAPKWKPATQRGKPVRQQLVIPLNFQLGKEEGGE